ncbi:methyl-accepting chemotaxis protein [Acinetobacter bereziniae]|uniref:methyl-accepting chemotaxis protein n=1 Tax=Acinetobacter bereziniae TaxID=106648 RepID=UPI001115DAA2|nr:methyl-accepting chemotaxis protein [Acinetobacter bereziniae]TNL41159.1 methyl-accepting chemotaxis protein [Acinetobacter bereziniae]TNL45865.1 methyl-accepting chemotaxis protein [Acinetobacter bereziniae]
MKFFKYLIFTIFVFLSVNAYSKTVLQEYPNKGSFDSEASACQALASSSGPTYTYQIESSSPYNRCRVFNSAGTYQLGAWLVTTKDECKAGASNVYSGSVTIQNWKDNDEWLNLNDAMLAKFTGTTVCANSCVHKFDFLGSGEGDSVNGPVSFKGKYVSTAQTCTSPTQGPTDTLNGTKSPSTEGCKSGEAYCDKPTTGCPSGYTSGSFNGKQICVKNNPDPTKPNPNDPNNNPNNGNGKFDDSKIISAINDSKTAITNSINNAVNSINSSISSINQSITTVANAVNGTTNAVNNNTSAVNTVKSSVDALHNTINAVTTAVNNNTSAVTSAVNANTSATNAVKASVDALNSTVSAVTSAVDNNTKAVNANGDKVANAVKDNITATNAVKTAVENLNTSVNAVSDAVKTNGKNTVDAVNANGDKVTNAVNSNGDKVTEAVNKGVEATKENGKKLDGIKDGVENGNGILKQISKTLSEIKDFITEKPELENGTDPQAPDDQGIFDRKFNTVFSLSKSCPPDIPFNYDTEYLKGNFTISLNWLCLIFTFLAYPLQFLSHCIGLWILYEAAIRKEIKW